MIGEVELRKSLMEAKAVAMHSSRCLRKKVGAVLYDNEGRFLSYGANINPPGEPCDEGFCPRGLLSYAEVPADAPYVAEQACTAWHAEMVALLVAQGKCLGEDQRLISVWEKALLKGGVMVVTHEPCHECMPRLKVLGLNIYWPEGKALA